MAQELNVSVHAVNTYVLGGHGDTMVPVVNYTTVGGTPVNKLLPPDRVEAIVQRARDGGADIVKLLKTGSAYYAPSAAITQMVESILFDKKEILPCTVYLEGEYGIEGLYVGVPAKLGSNGVEKVIELELSTNEISALHNSASAVQELVDVMAANS